ncbi:MAG: hypothetical protein VZR73_13825, partial [Acutalibacteraceae bacterium]|nr:hypothetical protein [Acutalibacteraceae bacterium]
MSVEKSGKPVVGGLAEDTDDGSEVFNGRFKVVTEPFAKGRVILGMFVSDASAVYLFHFVDVQFFHVRFVGIHNLYLFILSVFAGHVSVVGNRGTFDRGWDKAQEKAANAAHH